MIKHFVQTCDECNPCNARPTVRPHPGRFPLETRPSKEVIIDYTDMITSVRGYRYVLMCVDVYTGWPEAYPTKREDSKSVIKFLVNHYKPQHGFPERVRSDKGTHFKNQDLRKVEEMLGLQHKFGTVYHPQSQGKVERINQTIKNKLAKICAQTKLAGCFTISTYDRSELREPNDRVYATRIANRATLSRSKHLLTGRDRHDPRLKS